MSPTNSGGKEPGNGFPATICVMGDHGNCQHVYTDQFGITVVPPGEHIASGAKVINPATPQPEPPQGEPISQYDLVENIKYRDYIEGRRREDQAALENMKLPIVHKCDGHSNYHVSIYDSGLVGYITHDVDVSELLAQEYSRGYEQGQRDKADEIIANVGLWKASQREKGQEDGQ